MKISALVFLVVLASGIGWHARGVFDAHIASGVASLGETIATDRIALRIESVREDPIGAIPYTPREGYTFIIPMISVTNISATTTALIPSLSFFLKDESGEVYNTAVAPLRTGEFGGPMLPHDTIKQEMAFEVRRGSKGLALYFTSGDRVIAEHLGR